MSLPTSREILAGETEESDESDEIETELVRGFMLTRGRTRATVAELAIETLVSAPAGVTARDDIRDRQHQRVRDLLVGPMSIAELSAHQMIPLPVAVLIASEMVAAGHLVAGSTLGSDDTDFLRDIRSALQLL